MYTLVLGGRRPQVSSSSLDFKPRQGCANPDLDGFAVQLLSTWTGCCDRKGKTFLGSHTPRAAADSEYRRMAAMAGAATWSFECAPRPPTPEPTPDPARALRCFTRLEPELRALACSTLTRPAAGREHGAWHPFDPAGEQAVEAAYQAGARTAQTVFFNPRLQQNVTYTYDLVAMQQVNSLTGWVRQIKRDMRAPQQPQPHKKAKGVRDHGSHVEVLDYAVPCAQANGAAAAGNDFDTVTGCQVVDASQLAENDTCSICMCEFDDNDPALKLSKCSSHYFHRACVNNPHCFKQSFLKCPVCKTSYGVEVGPQPSGRMTIERKPHLACEGYNGCGTWEINYSFHNGTQTESMPNPGTPYSGTSRTAYLPDTTEGREVLGLLKTAFQRGLTFAVGQSVTTGRQNTTVWNGVHHKTNLTGGSSHFGYPDVQYFERVKEELAQKGIS